LVLYCQPAYVMMAGKAPDSPAGRVDANSSLAFASVGSVVVSGAAYSGVAVAPRFVLTASHVAAAPAAKIQFVLNAGGDRTSVIQAAAVTPYPTAAFPNDDLALIELATPLPAGIPIYPLMRQSIAVGCRITLVGYGASGNGDIGVTVDATSTVKRIGENTVDSIQTTMDGGAHNSLFYLFDFDAPTGNGPSGSTTLGNAVETMLAGGDSGSPAFAIDDGSYRLVGINTFIASSEKVPNGFGTRGGGVLLTRPEFLQWIDATTRFTAPSDDYNVDAPTLPQWALIAGVFLMSLLLVRRPGRRHGA